MTATVQKNLEKNQEKIVHRNERAVPLHYEKARVKAVR